MFKNMYIMIKGKEGMDLKKKKHRGEWEGLKTEKGRGNDLITLKSQNLKSILRW